jgi:prepilin-type N-terminal cleavage/methylation domain-containing protein
MRRFKQKKEKGFTLVELLLAMAVISILSGAILVSISSQRKRAFQSKMLSELSGTIQPMLMCRTDDNGIVPPTGGAGGGNICDTGSEYGTWPSTSGNDFGNYTSTDGDWDDGSWHFYIDDGTRRICCNSGSARCHDLVTGGACNNTTP